MMTSGEVIKAPTCLRLPVRCTCLRATHRQMNGRKNRKPRYYDFIKHTLLPSVWIMQAKLRHGVAFHSLHAFFLHIIRMIVPQ